MTTLTVTLAMKGLLPGMSLCRVANASYPKCLIVSLAAIIIGRDALLSLSAFYIRYTSLPAPVSPVQTKARHVLTFIENLRPLLGFFHTLS